MLHCQAIIGERRLLLRGVHVASGLVWAAIGCCRPAGLGAADDVQRWIRQLGADAYADRQAAHEQLLQRGPTVLPQLREASRTGEPEVRQRAARLVDRLREGQFEVLLRQLTSTVDGPAPSGLPAWERYVTIVGDSPAARELYSRILRTAPDVLLQMAEGDPRLQASVDSLVVTQTQLRIMGNDSQAGAMAPERTALLLWLAVDDDDWHQPLLALLLAEWLANAGLTASDGESDDPLRRLASAWVRSPHTADRVQRMALARQFGLAAGVEPAREILWQPAAPPGDSDGAQRLALLRVAQVQEAILLVARFGGVENVPDLEPLLNDVTNVNQFQRRREIKFETRVQDLALLALVHLTGQSPVDYGFAEGLTENAQTVFAPQSIGFASDTDRQRALKQWRRWRVLHLAGRQFRPLEAVEGTEL